MAVDGAGYGYGWLRRGDGRTVTVSMNKIGSGEEGGRDRKKANGR